MLQQLRAQFFAPSGRSAFLRTRGRARSAWAQGRRGARGAEGETRADAASNAVADTALGDDAGARGGPELRFMKLQHRAHFKEAFQEALASLDKRERSVLRMSVVEGACRSDDIAKVYDVHRATAARWVSGARERLVEVCRAALAKRLAVGASELDEVMGEVQSHPSISLGISKPPPREGESG